jgi:hypothetical protein
MQTRSPRRKYWRRGRRRGKRVGGGPRAAGDGPGRVPAQQLGNLPRAARGGRAARGQQHPAARGEHVARRGLHPGGRDGVL